MTLSRTPAALSGLVQSLAHHDDVLREAPRLWVGLSGGADSTALLLTLKHSRYADRVRACHIDHGLHEAAADWRGACIELCHRLAVPLHCISAADTAHWPPKGSVEAWARRVRYSYWREQLGAGDVLLLGHHRDDQTETVALRLLQGRLPLPIPARRRLSSLDESRWLLRPFLAFGAQELRAAVADSGYGWIDDPSNADPAVLRSRLRHQLLPALRTGYAGGALDDPERWGRALRRCGRLTARLVEALAPSISVSGAPAGEVGWFSAQLLGFPWALQSAVTRCGVPMTQRQAQACQRALGLHREAQDTSVVEVTGDVQLWREGPRVVVWREPRFEPQAVTLSAAGEAEVALAHGTLLLRGPAATPLLVRPRRAGDRLSGGRSSGGLRDRLRALGVPRRARPSYPLVLSAAAPEGAGETAPRGEVVAVPKPVAVSRRKTASDAFSPPEIGGVSALFVAN